MSLDRILHKFLYYWCLFLGMDRQFVHLANNFITKNLFYKIYTKILNTLYLILLPFYYSYGVTYMDAYVEKPLLPILNRLNVYLHCVVACVAAWNQWINSQLHADLQRELQKCQLSECSKYRQLYLWKLVCFFAQGLAEFVAIKYTMQRREQTWRDAIVLTHFAIMHTILHLHLYQWYYVLWKILITLDDMLHTLRCSAILPAELNAMMQRLWQMDCICRKLMKYYQFYVLTWLLVFTFQNVMMIYMIFLMISANTNTETFVGLSIFCTIIKFVDTCLHILCCELVIVKRMELRHSMVVDYMDRSQETIEFILRDTLHKFSFTIYGMFDFDKPLALAILANALIQFTIVIQFHFILQLK